jgi:3-hydroxy-3-methylglutaryl CoA synthase
MSKKNTFLSILIIILLFSFLGWVYIDSNYLNNEEDNLEEGDKISKEVSLVLNFGDGEDSQMYSVEIKNDWTAFDVLEEILEEKDIELIFEEYGQGVFIKSIGKRENGEDNKYWLYYINNEMPQVSCDKKIITPGDKIEFRFQTSPY